jgi:hypothetical protein
MDETRKKIVAEVEAKQLTLSEASKKIGKNHAYLQQFIKRGVPTKLPEGVRRDLAELLGLSERELGGERPRKGYPREDTESSVDGDLGRNSSGDTILEIDIGIGAGGGGLGVEAYVHDEDGNTYAAENIRDRWTLPPNIMQGALRATAKNIRAFEVIGDSMQPILYDHDRAFIDIRATHPHPEGIFALFDGYGLVVKRLQIIVGSEPLRLRILSANPAYPPYERLFEEVKIIGRLAGRFTATFPT